MPVHTHQFQSTWTEVAGLRMHARVAELAPDAPPIVLVHGLGVSGTYMLPTARELALDHPVFIPDLPGHGKTDRPAHPLDVPGQADALAAWVRKAGPARAVYVGNSLGCQTVVDFAVRYPQHVEGAVLIGSTGDLSAGGVLGFLARGAFDLLAEPLSLAPILVRDFWKAGTLRLLQMLHESTTDLYAEKLRQMPVPTLVMRGSRDPIASQQWAERMVQLLPEGSLKVISKASHATNYSAPVEVAQAIGSYIAGEGSRGFTQSLEARPFCAASPAGS